jgi:prevent-host-death family protein
MIRPTDIHTLDSFRRKTKSHVERLQSTGRPAVLTVNGQPSVVVQDASAYEDQQERMEVLEAIVRSAAEADAGKGVDAKKAVRKLIDEMKRR